MAGKPNKRGFGYVRRLPSKRWQASYVGPDSARHAAPTTFQTKADAEGWLGGEQSLISSDRWSPPAARRAQIEHPVTLANFARTWLRDRPLKPRTREGYGHLLDRYLLPAFGGTALTGISPAIVRKWWSELDRTTPTVNARAYALLKTVLNSAIADDELTTNPCRIRAASSTPRAREVHTATLAELAVITKEMPVDKRAVVLICAWCALRLGEVLELRRGDLDLNRATIKVSRAVSWVGGRPIVGTPKSAAGIRSVAVPPHILPELKRHLDEHVGKAANSLLFPARDGRSTLQPSVLHDAWRKARAAAGRDDLRIHDLRHTGATMAAMTGATLAELQQRLGHSTVAAALRYQHAAQGRDAKIAAALSVMAELAESETLG